MKKYKHILGLYLRNPGFLFSFGIFLVTAIFSKILYHLNYGFYAEEIFTFLFMAALWLAFHLGIVVKRQFSSHRASLLPRYRTPHIHVVFAFYLLFVFVGCLWKIGLRLSIEFSPQGLSGLYLTCLLIAMLITYLGYLSIARILIYAYVGLLILSSQTANIILILNKTSFLVYAIAAGCVVFVLFLRNRLLHVKEDHLEYGHIFSWPPRRFILGQLKASQGLENFFSPLFKLAAVSKKAVATPPYPRGKSLFARAAHWNSVEATDFKVIWTLILLTAPLFLLFFSKQYAGQIFNTDVYSNFLLLSMSPVLITMGANYKRMAYWDYDLLKPVGKGQYLSLAKILK